MRSMSLQAIRSVLSPEGGDDFIVLLTIYDPDETGTIIARVADGWTQRLSTSATIGDADTGGPISHSTDLDDVLYGVVSNSQNFIFLPLDITLPDENDGKSSRCQINIYDVTQYLTPLIRTINGPPKVRLDVVLSSSPNTPEITFTDFYITNISYNRDVISFELNMINFDLEPFPQHSFTPQYFPGLF
jgi:hypothetical protein